MAGSSAKVTVGPELQRAVDQLVRDVAGDVVMIVEEIANDLSEGARREWYDNVTKRTGNSGESNDYRLELRGTTVRGIVYNDAQQEQRSRKKSEWRLTPYGGEVRPRKLQNYAYYVRRPGPFSKLLRGLNLEEYRTAMSYYRTHGELPKNLLARSMTDGKGRNRPVGISKITVNPAHYDGKNLWKLLILDRRKAAIDARLDDLDKALQRSSDRFSK
jgi:hypothetical protein